jgi:hypothetical protein
MRRRTVVVSVAFYAIVAGLLLGVLLQIFPQVLPHALATRIGHNSEGYVMALAVAVWLQVARPRLIGSKLEWPVTVLVAAVFLGLTVYLLKGGLPSRFKTLNEATLATAILIPYLQWRRPLRRGLAASLAVGVLILLILTSRTIAVTDLAETFGALLLAPIGFDLVDRGILDAAARTSRRARYGWCALLVAAPVVFSVLEYQEGVGSTGWIGEPVRFAVRITEAFIFMLFVELFFAVGLGRVGRPEVEETVPAEPPVITPGMRG